LVGGLIALLVVGLAVGGVLALSGGGGGTAGASVRTEPVSTTRDPFAPPQGTDTPPTQPVMPGPNAQTDGGHVGLYGGTLNQAACDKNQLITFLQSNPGKAAAWAGVLGIQTTQIAAYVNGLTPVILRSDTLVTNHGFSNGRATSLVAVLQAGTAVLVDSKGAPVTKCYCGNPLTAPPYYSSPPTYYGPIWSGWRGGSNYTTVTASTTVVNVFVLVDVHTNTTIYLQPGGTTPTLTNPTIPTTTTTTTTLPPQTQPAGPTPEQKAINQLNQAGTVCAPFPNPIHQFHGAEGPTATPTNDPNVFLLEVIGHTDVGDQDFQWHVDRTTGHFTPLNDLARVASDHCPQLLG
jgi:hypothetical protein